MANFAFGSVGVVYDIGEIIYMISYATAAEPSTRARIHKFDVSAGGDAHVWANSIMGGAGSAMSLGVVTD